MLLYHYIDTTDAGMRTIYTSRPSAIMYRCRQNKLNAVNNKNLQFARLIHSQLVTWKCCYLFTLVPFLHLARLREAHPHLLPPHLHRHYSLVRRCMPGSSQPDLPSLYVSNYLSSRGEDVNSSQRPSMVSFCHLEKTISATERSVVILQKQTIERPLRMYKNLQS